MKPKSTFLNFRGRGISRPALATTFFSMVILSGAADAATEYTYKFFKFSPTAMNRGVRAADPLVPGSVATRLYGSIQLSEFTFSRGGTPLNLISTKAGAIPSTGVGPQIPVTVTDSSTRDTTAAENATFVVDGDPATKWFNVQNDLPGDLIFEFATPTTIDSYNFATANDFIDRTPVNWVLSGSDNGTDWVVVDDYRKTANTLNLRYNSSLFTYQEGFVPAKDGAPGPITSLTASPAIVPANTPVTLTMTTTGATGMSVSSSQVAGTITTNTETGVNTGTLTFSPTTSGVYTVSATNAAGSVTRDINLTVVPANTLNYRYVRFSPTKLRNSALVQLMEFEFYNGNEKVAVDSVVGNTGSSNPANEPPSKAIDGIIGAGGKWLDYTGKGLTFDFGSTKTFNSYQFYTGDDADGRDPVAWTLEGSLDGVTWTMVEVVPATYPTPTARLAPTGKLPFSYTPPPVVPTPANLTWSSSGSPVWDLTSQNFTGSAGASAFTNGSNVLFNDTAVIKDVRISGDLLPNMVTFTNNQSYSLGGVTLQGSGSLVKSGSGDLAIENYIALQGPITVNNGSITTRSARALGATQAPGLLTLNNTILNVPATQVTERPLEITSSFVFVEQGQIFAHVGPFKLNQTLNKTGAGTLSFYGYDGSTTSADNKLIVSAGEVIFGTDYFNRTIFGGNRLNAVVREGATLRSTASSGFAGDASNYQTGINQFRAEGGTIRFAGRQYIPTGTVSTNGVSQGRIVLKGGTLVTESQIESVFPPGAVDGSNSSRSVISTEASETSSRIDSAGGTLSSVVSHFVFDVADGPATEDLVINAVINGNRGFIKQGAGNLLLNATNTYTAVQPNPPNVHALPHGTTVLGGTVTVNGGGSPDEVTGVMGSGTGPSPLLFAAGTTLAGIGTITGDLEANGAIKPGDSFDPVGTLTLGDTVLTGSYEVDINSSISDQIIVVGDLNITGASLTTANVQGVETDSEYIIATYSGTRTGSFTSVPAGFEIEYDDAAKQIILKSDGTVVTSGYEEWAATEGLTGEDAATSADPDGDGYKNILEFILGSDPNSGASTNAPTMVRNASGESVFSFNLNPDAAYLNPSVEYSTTLAEGSWTAAPEAVVDQSSDTAVVTLPSSLAVGGKLFARLTVTE